MTGELGKLWVSLGLDTGGLAKGKGQAEAQLRGLNSIVQRHAGQFRALGLGMTAGGAAITGALGLAVREAARFESEMRNVNTIARISEGALKALGKQALDLAGEVGQAPETMARGLYDIASSGFEGEEGLKVLRVAAKGASAGLTDTATSAKAVVAVLNAYSMSANKAAHVGDVLFKTVEKGVITYDELAQNIGAVVASASAANVSIEQVGAALATMTKGGIQAAEASTALNRIIVTFLKPPTELAKRFRELGVEQGATFIATKGLAEAIKLLDRAVSGDTMLLAQLGLEQRALKAALSLTREEGRAFASDMRDMANATGSLDAAFAEQEKSLEHQMAQLQAGIKSLQVTVGNVLLPSLTELVQGLKPVVGGMRAWAEANPRLAAGIVKITAAFGGLSLTLGPVVAAIPSLVGGLTMLGGGFTRLLGPAGLVVGALAGIGYAAAKHLGGLKGNVPQWVGGLGQKLTAALQAEWAKIDWARIWASVTGLADKLVDQIHKTNWTAAGKALGEGVWTAVEGALKAGEKITKVITDLMAAIDWGKVAGEVWPMLSGLAAGLTAALFNPETWITIGKRHWKTIAWALVGVITLPESWIRPLSMLTRIPLAGKIVEWLLTSFRGAGRGALGAIARFVADMAGYFWKGLTKEMGEGTRFLPRLRGGIAKALERAWVGIRDWGATAWLRLAELMEKAGAWIARHGPRQIAAGLKRALSGLDDAAVAAAKRGVEIGQAIIRGIADGLRQGWKWLRSTVVGTAERVKGWAKEHLGIKSPSTVFAEIGRQLGAGLAQGIVASEKAVSRAIGTLTAAMATIGSKKAKEAARATAQAFLSDMQSMLRGIAVIRGGERAGLRWDMTLGDRRGYSQAQKEAVLATFDEQQAVRGLADAVASLDSEYEQITADIRLFGQTTTRARLEEELQHGTMRKAAEAAAKGDKVAQAKIARLLEMADRLDLLTGIEEAESVAADKQAAIHDRIAASFAACTAELQPLIEQQRRYREQMEAIGASIQAAVQDSTANGSPLPAAARGNAGPLGWLFGNMASFGQTVLQNAQQASQGVQSFGTTLANVLTGAGRDTTAFTGTWEEETSEWAEASQAVMDSIRTNFEDALVGLVEGTSNLRDFWKSLWRDILRIAVHNLVNLVFSTKQAAGQVTGAFQGMGSSVGSVFGQLGNMLGGLFRGGGQGIWGGPQGTWPSIPGGQGGGWGAILGPLLGVLFGGRGGGVFGGLGGIFRSPVRNAAPSGGGSNTGTWLSGALGALTGGGSILANLGLGVVAGLMGSLFGGGLPKKPFTFTPFSATEAAGRTMPGSTLDSTNWNFAPLRTSPPPLVTGGGAGTSLIGSAVESFRRGAAATAASAAAGSTVIVQNVNIAAHRFVGSDARTAARDLGPALAGELSRLQRRAGTAPAF